MYSWSQMLKDPLNTFNGYIKVLECVSYMVFPETRRNKRREVFVTLNKY